MYRFERKFIASIKDLPEVYYRLKCHPFMFRPVFYPRIVNNIYFDTPEFDFLYDNLSGIANRHKIRVRWYGEMPESMAVLEKKIKKGHLGKKESRKIGKIRISHENLSIDSLKEIEKKVNRYYGIFHSKLLPVLFNSYKREYFQSEDKKFRMTIDSNLQYRRILLNKNYSLPFKENSIIIEIKYDEPYERESDHLHDILPFRLTKNSKYVKGMQLLYWLEE